MSSRRTAILLGAIAVGVVAVLLIVRYVNGIEDQVAQDNTLVPVFVAKNEIKRGSDGDQAIASKDVAQANIPQQFRPATAIQSTDAISKKVALFTIAPGTVIVDGMFVDPATTTISFRERLKNKNHVAISILVDQVKGVGGFLVPGDEVNMMIYQDNAPMKEVLNAPNDSGAPKYFPALNLKPEAPENYINNGGAQWIIMEKTARYLFQKVQILAVGSNTLLGPGEQAQSSSSGSTSSNNTGLVTFNVPPEAAQWIATGAAANNGLYLTLVGKDYAPRPLLPLPVVTDHLPGEDQGILCPYKYDPDGSC